MIYRISILPEPDLSLSNTPRYYWCILGQTDSGDEVNCGSGWASSITQAANDASGYYKQNFSSDMTVGSDGGWSESRIRKKYRQICKAVNLASVNFHTAGRPSSKREAQERLNALLMQQQALESQYPWLVSEVRL